MTDSMNFGPEWLRNLSSDGSTTGGTGGGVRYQLSGYRYGREEMLGLYEKGFKPPASLVNFTTLYTDPPLVPLVLTATTEEERMWQNRPPPLNSSVRGSRGSSLERGGGRSNRGRGSYQYGRSVGSGYETSGGGGVGWGNGEQQEWSPRKDYNYRSSSVDNWRRNRTSDDDEGWRSTNNRGPTEKWGRSMSWRDGDKDDDRGGPHERNRNWHDARGHVQRRGWDEDHQQPEWFTEQLGEGGGTFDSSGAYHGSDDEQDHRGNGRKELQKSASQQNISTRQPAPLTSSKSSASLSKQPDVEAIEEKVEVSKKEVQDTKDKQDPPEKLKVEEKPNLVEPKLEEKVEKIENTPNLKIENSSGNVNINGIVTDQGPSPNRVEEDFDRLQEDLVSKLVVEEETPKAPMNPNLGIPGVGVTPQPPPNLVPPIQDKWYYQDPQGDLQGPFVSTEMAEWFKAGYFTLSLLVKRQCDKSFYTLGELVRVCNGVNPFLSTTRIPPLKEMSPVKMSEQDHLYNLQFIQAQLALRQSRPYKPVPTDWANLTALQQRDMLAQHLMPQAQMTPVELQYFQQSAQPPPSATNPLMHIINQMQQVNKLPGQPMADQPNAMPMQIDPLQALVQQMHSLQRIQPGASALPGMGMPQAMPSENLINNISGMHGNLSGPGLTGIPSSIPSGGVLPGTIPQKPLENLTTPTDDNPINNLLRQLQNKNITQPPPLDALWQQNQFVTSQTQPPNQWQQPPVQTTQPPPQTQPQQQQPPPPHQQQMQQSEVPISMWDLTPGHQMNTNPPGETAPSPTDEIQQKQNNKEKEIPTSKKDKDFAKEEKKRKEQEEKQLKKEAEEKRKQEQRRQEVEKKVAEEKKKKEEERIRKELEKARKEAEDKRLRELEEKRKLKEARKAEEEARKRAEEHKRLEDEQEKEKAKEEVKRVIIRTTQENQSKSSLVKAAPWSQSNVATGPSFVDIQKAEREKRVEQALLKQQRQLHMQEQQTIEKTSMQLSWANKPMQPRQVKSVAEIQAEEQELLAKQAAERLAQQHKEKENNTVQVPTGIWQGQNLTWANTASQWSSSNVTGFWDDIPSQKVVSKPSNVVKSNSTSAMATMPKPQQQSKPAKCRTKKDEVGLKNNSSSTTNGPATEEFTQWCIKALSNVASTVDIPTFIGFLKDIESAAEVKDYCREYLGESQAMHQFTAQFLEKRRSFKPKTNAHKDDMCSPAPAITPSMQHNSDFQEVKGKGKKTKKSKMTKVDSRILGFNVTAAQDRINVGDRDYGDN